MKHAYLIIAHHEFEVLSYLLRALDDPRNDIYIHFDKKVEQLPQIHCVFSRLEILEHRIDVRWADFSQIEVELHLFATAAKYGTYDYYHLLSGVDIPLKSQDFLHEFFEKNKGKEFIGYTQGNLNQQLTRKVKRYHLFPKNFKSSSSIINLGKRTLRALYLRIQEVLNIERNPGITLKKGSNWVSVTHRFVEFLLLNENMIKKTYRQTFCADEIFKHTLCWNSSFREAIYDVENEAKGSQRMIQWIDNQIFDWSLQDLPSLLDSDLLFARKFNSHSTELLIHLANHNKTIK